MFLFLFPIVSIAQSYRAVHNGQSIAGSVKIQQSDIPVSPSPPDESEFSWAPFLAIADTIMGTNWEDVPTGMLTEARVEAAYDVQVYIRAGIGHLGPPNYQYDTMCYIHDDAASGSRVMRAHYRANQIGQLQSNTDTSGGGYNWNPIFADNIDTVYVTTLVKWEDPESDTVYEQRSAYTGKHPGGLMGGTYATEGDWDNDCNEGPCDGFSMGLAFGGISGGWLNTLRIYFYHVDMPGSSGQTFYLMDPDDLEEFWIMDGEWHSITIGLLMNDAGSANGRFKVWIDGKFSLEQTGLRFRQASNVYIDWMKNYYFWGGSNWGNRSLQEEHIWVDDNWSYVPKDPAYYNDDPITVMNWDNETDTPIFTE